MYITISCLGMKFNGNTIKDGKSLGGSETAGYHMAKELAKMGNTVTIFTTDQNRGKFDGVNYEWCGEMTQQTPLGHIFHAVVQSPIDVCIIQRHPLAFVNNPNSKLNIWWLHDLALYRNQPYVQRQLPFIDKIFTVSQFHKDQVSKVYDIPKEFILATQNGVDYSIIPNWKGNIDREPKSLLFAARPERGLAEIVFPNGIAEKMPDYKFYIAGYDNTTAKMKDFYLQLWDRCQQLPNVVNLGHLSKSELYKKMCECEAYIYPTIFEDTSNILAMEAQACGLPWISCNTGALSETLKGGGYAFSNQKNIDKQVNIDNFVKTIKNVFKDDNLSKLRDKTGNIYNSWSKIAIAWDMMFTKMLKEKSNHSRKNLIRHFELNSDIVALKKLNPTKEEFPHNKYYDFAFNNDPEGIQKHYKAYYKYEKDRGVNYGSESLDGNRRFELTYNLIKKDKALSILDYGCAHGHYTINLAKRLDKNIQLTGVDLEKTNIDIAVKWAIDDRIDNVSFFTIDQDEWQQKKYDIILAEEVLEHVIDPVELINKLKSLLTENGKLIISTPYGPWEAIGYEEHKGWRAHLHYFERADLEDMFSNQKEFKLLAIPHSSKYGHYIVQFLNSNEPLGKIDYERKLNTQVPKESISLCFIAKNDGDDLAKNCKKLRKYVDEIVVGVDKTSTDNTLYVANQYGDVVIEIDTPAGVHGTGFDYARNRTIEKATCDWILWLDCDESLENPEILEQYTRNNCINGYFVPQHHYSAEPAMIIKTDYPIRLFRNNKDIKFWGFVHEHPETEINKGVGKVAFINGVHIMHMGYSTETIRRKRFQRNFPMMKKEIKINPERYLSIFLYLRDLGNLLAFEAEKYGDIRQDKNVKYAKDIIECWNRLLKAKRLRMLIDGLPYYSRAVNYLGLRGVNYKTTIALAPAGNKPQDIAPIDATFQDRYTVERFLQLILEESCKHYDDKYF